MTTHVNELSERIRNNIGKEVTKHADFDAAASARTLVAALNILIDQLDSITPKLIAFSDLIGGPEPQTDGTLAHRTVFN